MYEYVRSNEDIRNELQCLYVFDLYSNMRSPVLCAEGAKQDDRLGPFCEPYPIWHLKLCQEQPLVKSCTTSFV